MRLDPNRWFVKLFFWSVGIWDAFTGEYLAYNMRHRTNLCFFVRVIVLWMPLSILANLLLMAGAIYTLIVYPIERFGLKGYGTTVGGLIFGIIALIALSFIGDTFDRSMKRRSIRKQEAEDSLTDQNRGPGALEVLLEWVKAQKRKVCPIITFIDVETSQ